MQRSWWKLWLGLGVLVLLAACGQPAATGTEPAASQAPVTLGGSGQTPSGNSGGTTSMGGSHTTSHGGPVADHGSFVDHLRGKGLMVEPVGAVEQPFLHTKGETLRISGGEFAQPIEMQSYDYPDAATAEADVAQIEPNGNPKATMVEWRGTPHWFRKERVVVIYLGDDPAAIKLLTDALGAQFAGR